jgi:Zn finger protein HypA/HybF involved in hydrogenase expression
VLPCKACRCPVDIESTSNLKRHRVRCLKCGRQTPEMVGGELLDVLKLWNEMVE